MTTKEVLHLRGRCEICGKRITEAEHVALERDIDFVAHGDDEHLIRRVSR